MLEECAVLSDMVIQRPNRRMRSIVSRPKQERLILIPLLCFERHVILWFHRFWKCEWTFSSIDLVESFLNFLIAGKKWIHAMQFRFGERSSAIYFTFTEQLKPRVTSLIRDKRWESRRPWAPFVAPFLFFCACPSTGSVGIFLSQESGYTSSPLHE